MQMWVEKLRKKANSIRSSLMVIGSYSRWRINCKGFNYIRSVRAINKFDKAGCCLKGICFKTRKSDDCIEKEGHCASIPIFRSVVRRRLKGFDELKIKRNTDTMQPFKPDTVLQIMVWIK